MTTVGRDRVSTLVGRERELGQLLVALERAIGGRGGLVLIAGEPGIGKSRLADELAERARDLDALVLVGRCWEAGGAPAFWPWVQALRSLVRGRAPETVRSELGEGAPDLAQILPELRELFPDLPLPRSPDSADARFRLFDATATFLQSAAETEPILVVLDDVHAADEPSLLLLRFIARGLDRSRILVVCAYRDVDPVPTDPLAATLAELAREPVARTLALTGLGAGDVARFIEATTARPPPEGLAATVHAKTEGNPLFVGEIVSLLAAEERLHESAPRLTVPATLAEVIGSRLRHLSADCNDLLVRASVFGREFELDTLARATELERDAQLGLLNEATVARIVSELPGSPGRLRFVHTLIRDAVYERTPRALRTELERDAAEALEEVHREDLGPHLAEIALHFSEAQDPRAADYARLAADRAAALLAYEEAVRLYGIALALIDDDGLSCDLLLTLGHAQLRAGDADAGKQTYLQGVDLARRLGRPDALARAALGYGGRFVWARAGSDDHLVPLLREALASADEREVGLRARLLARLAAALGDEFDPGPRAALSSEAVRLARSDGDAATLAYALVARYAALWSPENPTERLDIAGELIELAERNGDKEREIEGRGFRFNALLELGDLPAARNELQARGRLTDEMRQPAQVWVQLVLESALSLFIGELETADRTIHRALEVGESAQGEQARVDFELQRFWLRREQGRLAEIALPLETYAASHRAHPIYRCALASLCVELGRRHDAEHRLNALAEDDFGALPRDGHWLLGMTLLAEVCCALDDRARAAVLYERLTPYAELNVAGWGEVSAGAVSRYLGMLATVLRRWDDADRHFAHALVMNERMGARPWVAHTQHDYARMLNARDQPDDAERAGELLTVALASSRELGLRPLERRVAQALGSPADVGTFAGYRIEAEIGRGGMGVVYRATELSLERQVALKLIAPELSTEEGFRKRFLRESRLAASLDHPHVLPVFSAGEEQGQLYLAMRYVEGEDLKALLARERRLEPERALHICSQVAEALDAAHRRGLVHRDLKPANVLLDEAGEAYLADFGLTKQVGSASTETGRLVGTLDYLAPEQIRGEEMDARTDEYAVACVLFECLAGRAPFHRQTEAELLWAHLQEEPPPLPAYPELEPVFSRALAKEREARYESAALLCETAASALGLETPRLRRRRKLLRRSRLLIAAGVAILAAAGAAITLLLMTGTEAGRANVPPGSVAAIDPATNRVVAAAAVGDGPTRVLATANGVWVLNQVSQTLSLIDPETRDPVRTFGVGAIPVDLALDSHGLWVASTDGQVALVDPGTQTVVRRFKVRVRPKVLPNDPSLVGQLASGFGSLWIAGGGRTLARIDPETGRTVATIHGVTTGLGNEGGLAVGKDSLWTADLGNVTRVDPVTNTAQRVPLGVSLWHINGLAADGRNVWLGDVGNNRVWEVGGITPQVIKSVAVGLNPAGLAFGHGSLWVTNAGDGTLMRIDPKTGEVMATITVGGAPIGVAVDSKAVWVTVD